MKKIFFVIFLFFGFMIAMEKKEFPEEITELEKALSRADPFFLESVSQSKVSVETVNKEGNTPLLQAIRSGIDSVKHLIEAGANVNAQNHKTNKSCLDYAFETENRNLIDLLVAYGAFICSTEEKIRGFLEEKVQEKDLTRYLLVQAPENAIIRIRRWGNLYTPPLHLGLKKMYKKKFSLFKSENQLEDYIHLLLSSRAHINTCDYNNHLPLFIALENFNEMTVKKLLDFGAIHTVNPRKHLSLWGKTFPTKKNSMEGFSPVWFLLHSLNYFKNHFLLVPKESTDYNEQCQEFLTDYEKCLRLLKLVLLYYPNMQEIYTSEKIEIDGDGVTSSFFIQMDPLTFSKTYELPLELNAATSKKNNLASVLSKYKKKYSSLATRCYPAVIKKLLLHKPFEQQDLLSKLPIELCPILKLFISRRINYEMMNIEPSIDMLLLNNLEGLYEMTDSRITINLAQ